MPDHLILTPEEVAALRAEYIEDAGATAAMANCVIDEAGIDPATGEMMHASAFSPTLRKIRAARESNEKTDERERAGKPAPNPRIPLNLTEHPKGGVFLLLSQRGTPPPLVKTTTPAPDAVAPGTPKKPKPT